MSGRHSRHSGLYVKYYQPLSLNHIGISMVDPVLVLYMHIIDMHIVNYDYVYPPIDKRK